MPIHVYIPQCMHCIFVIKVNNTRSWWNFIYIEACYMLFNLHIGNIYLNVKTADRVVTFRRQEE